MRVKTQIQKLGQSFPWGSLVLSLFLILSVQFINRNLLWIPFFIQLYRILRYDVHVFMVDLAVLVNFGTIFRLPIGGAVGLLVVIATVWFSLFIFKKSRISWPLLILSFLVFYLFFRSYGKIVDYIFISSALILSYLLINQCTVRDSVLIAKGFIFGVLIASIYGFVFRGSSAITYYIADDSVAMYEIQDAFRFRAIFGDSNYYSCYLILGILLMIELYLFKQSNILQTVIVVALLSCFGIATYSRTFFLTLILLLVCSIYLLFKNGRKGIALLLCSVIGIIVGMVLSGKITAFDVILARLFDSNGMEGFTSGRNELLIKYGTYILQNTTILFFGEGLGADLLGTRGTHNLYLEILYYVGGIGGLLYAAYLISLTRIINKKRNRYNWKQKLISLLPILLMMVMYFTLQGMFMTATYTLFWIAISAMLLPSLLNSRKGSTEVCQLK